ncbi:MAG TPA: S-adenosylmethionine decarboxylase [Gemmatimonadaceae bacterium]|nr:S-adenosylmethionine decarboxylase [Gemmatimonadaceae bacterium]
MATQPGPSGGGSGTGGAGAARGADAPAGSFTHLVADFIGVPPQQLRDTSMLSGLLIAAAGAAGFAAVGAPIVRQLPHDGVAGLFLLDGCQMTVHAFPERELLLLDVLTSSTHDGRKAFDVFARRIVAREVRSERMSRG